MFEVDHYSGRRVEAQYLVPAQSSRVSRCEVLNRERNHENRLPVVLSGSDC